jgi:triosephosphate isomerase
MSRPIIVANWKMNPPSLREAKSLFDATRKVFEKTSGSTLVIAPPAIYLRELHARYKGRRIHFGAQDMSVGDCRRVHRRNFAPRI